MLLMAATGAPSARRWQLAHTRHAVARKRVPCGGDWLYVTVKTEARLPPRLRSLIGTLLLIVLVIVYALVASAVAVTQLAESSAWVHLAFFAISGLVWVVPAMAIVWWMVRPARSQE